MIGPDGREYRVISRLNPLCVRPYLKANDVVPVDFDCGWARLPDEVRGFDIVRQVRDPGGEWEDF